MAALLLLSKSLLNWRKRIHLSIHQHMKLKHLRHNAMEQEESDLKPANGQNRPEKKKKVCWRQNAVGSSSLYDHIQNLFIWNPLLPKTWRMRKYCSKICKNTYSTYSIYIYMFVNIYIYVYVQYMYTHIGLTNLGLLVDHTHVTAFQKVNFGSNIFPFSSVDMVK